MDYHYSVPAGTRFPLDALEQAVSCTNASHMAERLCVNRGSYLRWRRSGLTWIQADQLATRCGLHPMTVWPDYHDHAELIPESLYQKRLASICA